MRYSLQTNHIDVKNIFLPLLVTSSLNRIDNVIKRINHLMEKRMDFLNSLREDTKRIENVTKRLDGLTKLFSNGETDLASHLKAKYGGFSFDDSIECLTIFQSPDITITLGTWKEENKTYPTHIHSDSIEFLIGTKGKFYVKTGKGDTLILKVGECITIPQGLSHTCIAIENNSQMVGICIPPESAYLRDGD